MIMCTYKNDYNISQINGPNSFAGTISCLKQDNWLATIEEELTSIQDAEVWDPIELFKLF